LYLLDKQGRVATAYLRLGWETEELIEQLILLSEEGE